MRGLSLTTMISHHCADAPGVPFRQPGAVQLLSINRDWGWGRAGGRGNFHSLLPLMHNYYYVNIIVRVYNNYYYVYNYVYSI